MLTKTEIAKLIRKKYEGTLDRKEQFMLEELASQNVHFLELLRDIDNSEVLHQDLLLWLNLDGELGGKLSVRLQNRTLDKIKINQRRHKHFFSSRIKMVYQAAALIIISAVLYFYIYRSQAVDLVQEIDTIELSGEMPSIKMHGGRIVELKMTEHTVVISDNLKYKNGAVIEGNYIKDDEPLELSTPKGRTYELILSDGTHVWLNADSKISFPKKFSGNERLITLEGEAFFDVAKDKGRPFIVKTLRQEVEVLGTKFNIKAYEEDFSTTTTLLEGSVKINTEKESVYLTPNEQSIVKNGQLTRRHVLTDQYVGWRANKFVFYETELRDAILGMGRWYNFEVVNMDKLPAIHIYGTISRSKKLSEVMQIMGISGLTFKIDQREKTTKLIVME